MSSGRARLFIALVLPFGVLAIQSATWAVLEPFSWFLFVAGVFLSSWIGGLRGGIGATILSAILVWFFFLPPAYTFEKYLPNYVAAVAIFLALGGVISFFHELLARAQEAVRSSQARIAGIVSSAFDAIISIDGEQRIVLFNEAAARLFGYAREEVLGKPVTMLMPERFRAPHEQHLRGFASAPDAARTMGDRPAAIFGLRKNGEEFAAEATISKVALEEGPLFTVVLRDVTVRRRIERELARTLDEQKFLAEVGAIFASSLDPAETLTRVAQSSVEFMADFVIVDLLEEGALRRVKVAHSDPAKAEVARALADMPRDRDQPPILRAAIATRQTQVVREVTDEFLRDEMPVAGVFARVKAMEPRSTMFVPLIAHDEVIGVMSFVSSTPGKQYGPSDIRLAEEVARRAALALENSHLYKVAHDAIEARDEILGVVAHDLRNPLNTIQLRADLLLAQLSPETRTQVESSVGMILRSSERASRLIQDLLEVRKAQVGRLTLRREHVSAARMILDLAEAQRPLLSSAMLDLEVEVPPTLPILVADRDRVIQVFENLLSNATKFTPKGGKVTIGCRDHADGVLFWVADTGPGIAPDQMSHLFHRFWQAHDADRRGAGLGLSIAKQVVEAHGGKIWAESNVGSGTTFFFTIPASIPAAPELRDRG